MGSTIFRYGLLCIGVIDKGFFVVAGDEGGWKLSGFAGGSVGWCIEF